MPRGASVPSRKCVYKKKLAAGTRWEFDCKVSKVVEVYYDTPIFACYLYFVAEFV